MRINQPVTQREYPLPDDKTIVSVTDLKGRIVYCNSAFVVASGFSREELMGQAHNIVRHPDMPEEAYRDLWETLQAQLPWTGLVKNRRKDGDHYWVRANATPMMNGDSVVGYLSVRTVPAREEVVAAESLYAVMREEASRGRLVHVLRQGRVLRNDLLGRFVRLVVPGVRGTAMLTILAAAALSMLAAVFLPWLASLPLAAGACLLAGWVIDRIVLAPVAQVVAVANRLASGDLSNVAAADGKGVLGDLQRALTQLGVNMRTVIGDAREELVRVTGSIDEIAAGNHDLSSRTESQASSLEETAASMEEINSTIQQSAGAATEGARLANETASVAHQSHDSVQGVAEAMNRIRESSEKIGEIVQVVEGVSFQTNILALNAAVEAARAGEQGRGFSVVAAEVRALAQRTGAATKEIRELIAEASRRVEEGGAQTADASSRMQVALDATGNVSRLLAEISASASEQRSGVAQVSDAVMHLDSITQQNAAMVEQLAAAASALREQAAAATESMGLFRIAPGDVTVAEVDAVGLRRESRRTQAAEHGQIEDFDVQTATAAHLAWKTKLRAAAAHNEPLDASTIRRDDACKLGQWLHGPGERKWGSRPSFAALLEDHRGFHQCAADVADRIAAGRGREAEKMLEGGTPFSEAAQKVVMAIRRFAMEEHVGQGGGHGMAKPPSRPAPAPQARRPAPAAQAATADWQEF